MKSKQSKSMRSLMVTSACLLLAFTIFYSCKKSDSASSETKTETITPNAPDQLLSVANVYTTEDGKKNEVWFYETPVVFEFNVSDANAKQYVKLLEEAKKNNAPVNVRITGSAENQIAAVAAPSAEQIASYRTEMAKRAKEEAAVEVGAPDGPKQRLVGVVPDMTTLNTIFSKIQTQCCKAAGPYIYGQCIPFQYVADGCYARAHKMRQVIESYYGYTSYKVFNYACNGLGTLAAKATLWNNNCCVKWWYHVTSYVIVQVGSSQYGYAIDPAMFSGPVSIPTWIAAQKNTTCGYNGAAQGQVYYSSNAYAPGSINTSTCTIVPTTDNTYTAANAKCAQYAPKQGCF